MSVIVDYWGTWWCSWLRHCATSRKVVSSIRDGIMGIFIYIILSAALWHWSRLNLQGTRDRLVQLTTLPASCADCLEILGASTYHSPDGLSRLVKGQLYPYFYWSITRCYSSSCRKRLSKSKRDLQSGYLATWSVFEPISCTIQV
jgi:hypothetical protein